MSTYFRSAPELVASGTISGSAGSLNNVLYSVPANRAALVEIFRIRHSEGFTDGYTLDVALTTTSTISVFAATTRPRAVAVLDYRPCVTVGSKSNTGLFFEINGTNSPRLQSFFNAGEIARGLVNLSSGGGSISVAYDYRVWLFGS
jgi:hypothetical protein